MHGTPPIMIQGPVQSLTFKSKVSGSTWQLVQPERYKMCLICHKCVFATRKDAWLRWNICMQWSRKWREPRSSFVPGRKMQKEQLIWQLKGLHIYCMLSYGWYSSGTISGAASALGSSGNFTTCLDRISHPTMETRCTMQRVHVGNGP